MMRRGVLIACAIAALVACGKSKSKDEGGGGGGTSAPALPATMTWQLDQFQVTVPTPEGWQFWEVDGDFGKVSYAIAKGDFANSLLTISSTCGGSCQIEKFEENLEKMSDDAFSSFKGAAWDKPLTEVRPGVWLYRFHSERKVELSVAYIDKRVTDQMLFCSASLTAEDVGQADALEKLCTDGLKVDVKAEGAPLEAAFGGKYKLDEFNAEVPAPPDWKFASYSVGWGRVSFKRGFGTKLEVGATCGGRCKEDLLADNIKGEADQDFESMGHDGEATWVKEFSEVEPGIYLHRVRRTKDGNVEEERVKVAAIRKGAEHYFYCTADLGKDDVGLADAMEKYCLERATAAQ